MVDKKIEPFDYQKSTNIDEHNQIVGKVNEIVDAINEVNLDEIAPEIADLDTRVDKNTTDISQLKISDTEHTDQIATIDSNVDNHAREITALKAKDATHDTEIAELDKVTNALTKEIPNGITLYRDGTGKIKAVISQEDDTTIDSNTLDMIIPYQYTIISGTSSRSFKLKIVMSDGSEVITNDFIIPEGGGSVVTITGIEIDKDATDANKFLVKAIVNEGDPITSNAITMVDSVSGTFANNKLTIKVNGISSTPITIDTTGTTYTAGTGIKIASGVISIDDTKVALKSDISDMETKTHANATFATKTALTTLQNSVGDAFSQVAVGSDGKSLDFTALDGQVNNVVLPSSGGSDDWVFYDGSDRTVLYEPFSDVPEMSKKWLIEVLYYSTRDTSDAFYSGFYTKQIVQPYDRNSNNLLVSGNFSTIIENLEISNSYDTCPRFWYGNTELTQVTKETDSLESVITDAGQGSYKLWYKP